MAGVLKGENRRNFGLGKPLEEALKRCFFAALRAVLGFCFMTPGSGDPDRLNLPRLSAHPYFRTVAIESMRRGDQARERGHLVPAARHYATAGVTFRFIGSARAAAVAFLELGGVHLVLGRAERLPGVVESLRALRPVTVFVQVAAVLLGKAPEERRAFAELLDELRQQRREGEDPDFAPVPAGRGKTTEEEPEMSEPPFALPLDELRRGLAGHPDWEITENGARLVRVIPLADLQRPANDSGRELRPLQRSAAEVAQRMVRMGVPVSCSFDGERVEIRVPATRLGLGFIAECEHAALGSSAEDGATA